MILFDAHSGVSTTYMQSTDFGCKIEPHGFDKVINGSEAEVNVILTSILLSKPQTFNDLWFSKTISKSMNFNVFQLF